MFVGQTLHSQVKIPGFAPVRVVAAEKPKSQLLSHILIWRPRYWRGAQLRRFPGEEETWSLPNEISDRYAGVAPSGRYPKQKGWNLFIHITLVSRASDEKS